MGALPLRSLENYEVEVLRHLRGVLPQVYASKMISCFEANIRKHFNSNTSPSIVAKDLIEIRIRQISDKIDEDDIRIDKIIDEIDKEDGVDEGD